MSSSSQGAPAQGAPRKFSEKIAIMQRKMNEDADVFSRVMQEVKTITESTQQPAASSPTLDPGQWNRPCGSLPNMHEAMYQQPYWPEVPTRGRSPGAHYHPYRSPRPHDRVPPLHGNIHYPAPPPQHLLQPTDQWNVFGRARSDTAIHTSMSTPMIDYGQPPMVPYPTPVYNGSGSVLMMPHMDNGSDSKQDVIGSLPNMNNVPPQLPPMPGPSCYHAQVGQRHSTGCGTRLAPSYTPESQSAPTSPAQLAEHSLAPCWPVQRHYSNSPEALDIPNIVLTEADGTRGADLDCFDSINVDPSLEMFPFEAGLQDLHLDGAEMQSICNGSPNGGSPMSEGMPSSSSPDTQVYH